MRSLGQEHGVSISTVQQAYQTLENLHLIIPQPRSGYFVAPRKALPPVPAMTRPVQRPVDITQWDQVLTLLDARQDKNVVAFGSGSPDVTQPSLKPLWREMSRLVQHHTIDILNYDELPGRRLLREQIARLMFDGGTVVSADELVITNGCHGALALALLAVCKPGDIVAVESPSFHGTMQLLRGFDIKAIEIPTDSQTGISIEALEMALDQWPIKAVILVPTAIIRWALLCRTSVNARCSPLPSATILPSLRMIFTASWRPFIHARAPLNPGISTVACCCAVPLPRASRLACGLAG